MGGGPGGGAPPFQTVPTEWWIDSEARLIMRPRPTPAQKLGEEFGTLLALFGIKVQQPRPMTIVEATRDRIAVENVERPGEFFIYRRRPEPLGEPTQD
jgi:hypothetical protein